MKTVKPLEDRVLVEMLPESEITDGGIYLPDIYGSQPQARVVAVGPGRRTSAGKRVAPDVNVGDKVILLATGLEVRIGEKKYHIVEIHHVMAVFE